MSEGGDQIPISRLETQVEADASSANAELSGHSDQLRRTSQEAQRLGRASVEMGEQINRSVDDVRKLREELKAEQRTLEDLQKFQAGAARGGGIPQVDDAVRQSQERIAALKATIGDTGNEAVRAGAKMRETFLGTVSSVQDLERHLVALKETQRQGILTGTVTPDIAQEIRRTEAFLRSLNDTTRASARDMSQNFLATASSVDVIRQRLQALQEMQRRGAAAGVRTVGLPEEIARTTRVLKQVDDALDGHTRKLGGTAATYNIARSAVNTLNTEIVRMAGLSIPGLGQMEGVAAGLAERMTGLGAAGSLATFGVLAVGTAAVTSGIAMTIMGAQVQEATAKIATSSNISVEAAAAQENAFRTLRAGGVEASEAYANIAGMLRTYNGQALTTAQATDFMSAAQDGATATGQRLLHVTEGFARAMVATHTPLSQSRELMNVLYITSLNTGVSISQLGLAAARMVERTGAAAPSVRDLGIALTLAAQAGAQGQEGLEPVDNLIRTIANSSGPAKQNLDALGVSIAKNASGGIDLAETLINLKPAYEGLANDSQRYALAQQLAGQGAPVLQAMLKLTEADIRNIIKSYDDSNRVSKDAETHASTLGGMMGRLATQARDAAGATGNELAGSFVQAGDNADQFGSIINKLTSGLRDYNKEKERSSRLRAEPGSPIATIEQPKTSQAQSDVERVEAATQAARRERRDAQEMAAQAAAAQAAAAQAAAAQPPGLDIESLRRQQETLTSLTSEAQRLHLAMVATTADTNIPDETKKGVNDYLAALTQVEAAIQRAYDPAKPQETANRLAQLKTLTDQYDEAVQSLTRTNSDADRARAQGIQVQIDLLNQRFQREDIGRQQDQRNEAFRKQQAAEIARQNREAREADPLAGLAQALQKDREDLIGTAGQVMGDLNKAIELKGQQGARAAGEAFGNEARKWGEELEKAGVENWEASFNRLVELGRAAIATGSPGFVSDIRDMLREGEAAVQQANIGRAMADAMAKANAQMLEQQARVTDQLLRAQVTAADARAQALQTEVDREYDVWAGRQIERLETADRNGRELLRIREQWGREDTDREVQRLRVQADAQENANRAARDRAQDQARALRDLSDQQTRALADTTRQRGREDVDAAYEHQKRITEIQRQAALSGTTQDPTAVAKQIAEENYSYQQSIKDRTRKRGQDDAEAAIKQAQQVADAQRRQAEQVADANRKATEQASDLRRRQREETDDLGKTRTRQIQAREQQQQDAEWLKDQRLIHEQAFFRDADTIAQQRLQNELSRINARYQHEEERNATASERIQLKRAHDEEIAAIRAEERFRRITPEQSLEQQNEVELRFTRQSIELDTRLRAREQQIDQQLAQSIAGRQRYDPRFAPQNIPFEQTRQYKPPTPSFGRSAFAGAGTESLFAPLENQAKSWVLQFMGQAPSQEPLPVILPDQQIQEIIDGVGNLPPIEMDGEVVESQTSRIRRTQNRARTLG